jgi:hypothetical protein
MSYHRTVSWALSSFTPQPESLLSSQSVSNCPSGKADESSPRTLHVEPLQCVEVPARVLPTFSPRNGPHCCRGARLNSFENWHLQPIIYKSLRMIMIQIRTRKPCGMIMIPKRVYRVALPPSYYLPPYGELPGGGAASTYMNLHRRDPEKPRKCAQTRVSALLKSTREVATTATPEKPQVARGCGTT